MSFWFSPFLLLFKSCCKHMVNTRPKMVGEHLQKAENRCRRQLMLCRARQVVGYGRKALGAMGSKDLSLNKMGNLKRH